MTECPKLWWIVPKTEEELVKVKDYFNKATNSNIYSDCKLHIGSGWANNCLPTANVRWNSCLLKNNPIEFGEEISFADFKEFILKEPVDKDYKGFIVGKKYAHKFYQEEAYFCGINNSGIFVFEVVKDLGVSLSVDCLPLNYKFIVSNKYLSYKGIEERFSNKPVVDTSTTYKNDSKIEALVNEDKGVYIKINKLKFVSISTDNEVKIKINQKSTIKI